MNDMPQPGPHKYIRDRANNRYLASWSGPDSAPTSFTWDADISKAHDLLPAQAHLLRAGILSMPAEQGGLPETHVAIIDVTSAKAFATEMAKPSPGVNSDDRFLLYHPLQGYYVKHTLSGDQVQTTWSRQPLMGAILSRVMAENFREISGIPALNILPLSTIINQDGGGPSPIPNPGPLAPIPKVVPFPAPVIQPTKLRYEILADIKSEDLSTKVSDAFAKGAQIAGGLVVRVTNNSEVEYLQAVVWREPVPVAVTPAPRSGPG